MIFCAQHFFAVLTNCTREVYLPKAHAVVFCSRSYAVLLWADVRGFTVLGWLYLLSYFKLFVTSTKYVPQVRIQKQSTANIDIDASVTSTHAVGRQAR